MSSTIIWGTETMSSLSATTATAPCSIAWITYSWPSCVPPEIQKNILPVWTSLLSKLKPVASSPSIDPITSNPSGGMVDWYSVRISARFIEPPLIQIHRLSNYLSHLELRLNRLGQMRERSYNGVTPNSQDHQTVEPLFHLRKSYLLARR